MLLSTVHMGLLADAVVATAVGALDQAGGTSSTMTVAMAMTVAVAVSSTLGCKSRSPHHLE